MAKTIDGADLSAAIVRVTDRLLELRDRLNQLDAAMGDGDTGITVAKAAGGLRAYVDDNPPEDDLGQFLARAGMAVNRAASSTLGTLMATALMRAGKEAQGMATLDDVTLAKMLAAANTGIQERGKAKPGDKTLVDALHPATEAFVAAVERGKSLGAAGHDMLQAARGGRDAAIPLRSQTGRAAWVGERTENRPDPGTVLIVDIIETILGVDYSEPGSTLR